MVNHNRASLVITMSLLSFLFCINVDAGDRLLFYTKVSGQMKATLDGDQSKTVVDYRQSVNKSRFVINGKKYTLDDATDKFSPVRRSTRTGIKQNLQDEYTIEHGDYIKHEGKYYQVEWLNENMVYGNIGEVTYECENGKLKVNTRVSLQWQPLKLNDIAIPSSSSSSSSSSTASSSSSASSASLAPTTTTASPLVLTPVSASTSTTTTTTTTTATMAATSIAVMPTGGATSSSSLTATTTTTKAAAISIATATPSSSQASTRGRSKSFSQYEVVKKLREEINHDIKSIESKMSASEDRIGELQTRVLSLELVIQGFFQSLQQIKESTANMNTFLDSQQKSQKKYEEDHKKLHATINPFYKKPMDYLATAAMTVVPVLQWKSLLVPVIKAAAPKVAAAITPAVAPWIAPVLAGSGGLWWLYTTYVRKKACDEFDQTYYRMNRPWRPVFLAEGKNLLKPLKDFAKMGIGVGLSVLILSNQKMPLPTL